MCGCRRHAINSVSSAECCGVFYFLPGCSNLDAHNDAPRNPSESNGVTLTRGTVTRCGKGVDDLERMAGLLVTEQRMAN